MQISKIILILCALFMSSQISAKTLKGEKKQNHHNSKNIVLHSNKNYYVPNSSSHLDSKIINRKLNSTKTPNSSVSCIAETIFSESRGEPLLGQIAVGTTIVTRTKILNKNPCLVIRGQYTQKRIPSKDKDEFYTLASNVLDGKTKNSIGNSDSFDSFKHKKHPKGSIHIGKHFFYKALHS